MLSGLIHAGPQTQSTVLFKPVQKTLYPGVLGQLENVGKYTFSFRIGAIGQLYTYIYI